MTTNDNLDALCFYKRCGHEVTATRAIKPGIPETGAYVPPIQSELVLGKRL